MAVFINTSDSANAKLFSLLHEIAHIWLGINDLFNDRKERTYGVSNIEIICNAVAGELIVPKAAIETYNHMKENKDSNGGNYYNTMGSRLDACFLCESINMGRTTYTEAYHLTNTSRKTFSEVTQRLGDVEW